MSILIKGMEMPKNCAACPCSRGSECGITHYEPTFAEWYEDGVKDCPLVPVPPHGRLIDVDALISKIVAIPFRHDTERVGVLSYEEIFDAIIYELQNAPTIIPADKEDGE